MSVARLLEPVIRIPKRYPFAFGVITADTVDQAVQRAGVKSGNRGWDAGMNAVEMASLMAAIE